MEQTTVSCNENNGVIIRRIPYPYMAMLAICSDLDETPDKHTYLETIRFLNIMETTAMGQGIGLEVGNTIYFDMPPGQFSYWNTDDNGRAMIRALIHSGHIDCLHSYGDLAITRTHAGQALEELSRHDCKLEVWVDHGKAPSNFGSDIMQGYGDVKGSEVYHADITCGFGIKYVWRGRVTSVIGQDAPRSLGGIWSFRHPLASTMTVAREFAKGPLSHLGNEKYFMHGPNRMLRETSLRDGHRVFEFIRSNPHWGGVSCGETADGIADVLTESMLNQLIEREGTCILYTHLGKYKRGDLSFQKETRQALNLLAQYYHSGKILITTTRRLLGYCRALQEATLSVSAEGDMHDIDVTFVGDEKEISGLTLYVRDTDKTKLTFNKRKALNISRNNPDFSGRKSVSIPWKHLEFPAL